jgi:4-carboxymuconolactone decarboxylase
VAHEPDDRYARGLATLADVAGPTAEGVVAPLGDLGRYIVEFAFGDIYRRDGLGLREREIVTIASLVALGGREHQLRMHLRAGLHLGLTAKELEEVIIQTVPYAGFPTAVVALELLREETPSGAG